MSDDEVIELQQCPFCEKLFGVGTPLIQHVATHDEPASPPPAQVFFLRIPTRTSSEFHSTKHVQRIQIAVHASGHHCLIARTLLSLTVAPKWLREFGEAWSVLQVQAGRALGQRMSEPEVTTHLLSTGIKNPTEQSPRVAALATKDLLKKAIHGLDKIGSMYLSQASQCHRVLSDPPKIRKFNLIGRILDGDTQKSCEKNIVKGKLDTETQIMLDTSLERHQS